MTHLFNFSAEIGPLSEHCWCRALRGMTQRRAHILSWTEWLLDICWFSLLRGDRTELEWPFEVLWQGSRVRHVGVITGYSRGIELGGAGTAHAANYCNSWIAIFNACICWISKLNCSMLTPNFAFVGGVICRRHRIKVYEVSRCKAFEASILRNLMFDSPW